MHFRETGAGFQFQGNTMDDFFSCDTFGFKDTPVQIICFGGLDSVSLVNTLTVGDTDLTIGEHK